MSEEHYFTAEPASAAQRRPLRVRLDDDQVDLVTAPGVFSADRLDAGTQVLLASVPDPPDRGDLLDVGCGWGAIALVMAGRSPAARVWAVDVNARAVALTAHNAELLGRSGVHAVLPDEVPDDVRFAAIWSNPPIRIGKPALHALLLRWLPLLDADGVAHLVAAKQLGADSLQRWLVEQGWDAERVATDRGYRVLAVRRP